MHDTRICKADHLFVVVGIVSTSYCKINKSSCLPHREKKTFLIVLSCSNKASSSFIVLVPPLICLHKNMKKVLLPALFYRYFPSKTVAIKIILVFTVERRKPDNG